MPKAATLRAFSVHVRGLRLPLGLEAPVMTPNGVIFLFFLHVTAQGQGGRGGDHVLPGLPSSCLRLFLGWVRCGVKEDSCNGLSCPASCKPDGEGCSKPRPRTPPPVPPASKPCRACLQRATQAFMLTEQRYGLTLVEVDSNARLICQILESSYVVKLDAV